MKKEKVMFTFFRYEGKPVRANKEIPFEVRLQSRLILDEICFLYNKRVLKDLINKALRENNEAEFNKYSELYKQYIWE